MYISKKRMLDIAWLAGVIEGDGSIVCASPQGRSINVRYAFVLRMTDKDVVEKAQEIVGLGKIYKRKPSGLGSKIIYEWRLDRKADVCYLINLIYSFLGQRRKIRTKEALNFLKERLSESEFNNGKIKFSTDKSIKQELNEAWLAGLIDSEGSITRSIRRNKPRYLFYIEMSDKDIIERVKNILGSGTVKMRLPRTIGKLNIYVYSTEDQKELYKLLNIIQPYLGSRKRGYVDEALNFLETKKLSGKYAWKTI